MAIELNDAALVRQIGSGTDRQAEGKWRRRMARRIHTRNLLGPGAW